MKAADIREANRLLERRKTLITLLDRFRSGQETSLYIRGHASTLNDMLVSYSEHGKRAIEDFLNLLVCDCNNKLAGMGVEYFDDGKTKD